MSFAVLQLPRAHKTYDKEIIQRTGHETIYRLHISRSFTAFYKIYKDETLVKILDIMTIEQAHKIYGRF
jgi:hypothetical protein